MDKLKSVLSGEEARNEDRNILEVCFKSSVIFKISSRLEDDLMIGNQNMFIFLK